MAYYIKYPKNHKAKVSVVTKRPRSGGRKYGFSEGPLKSIQAVKSRLSWMNIPRSRRPVKFR